MVKDKIGQDIVPGVYIAYASMAGQSTDLKIGKVIKTDIQPTRYHRGWTGSGVDYKITVRGVVDGYSKGQPQKQLANRNSTLQFPDRMVVIPYVTREIEFLFQQAGI